MDWSGVDYCDVFISCLDSHSDGTHSLQSIHCWANNAILHFSKSDEETNSFTSWLAWGWRHFQQMLIFWVNYFSNSIQVHFLFISTPYAVHQWDRRGDAIISQEWTFSWSGVSPELFYSWRSSPLSPCALQKLFSFCQSRPRNSLASFSRWFLHAAHASSRSKDSSAFADSI